MRQIEDAICALEESCKSLSTYSNLCARQKTIRQKCLMRVAKAMSGENDGDELLADAAGINNVTAKKIAVSYQLAKCDPGNAHFRNRRAREWAVNVLSFLVGSGSRTSIETLGVSMGDDLYSSVKDFLGSGQLFFLKLVVKLAGAHTRIVSKYMMRGSNVPMKVRGSVSMVFLCAWSKDPSRMLLMT